MAIQSVGVESVMKPLNLNLLNQSEKASDEKKSTFEGMLSTIQKIDDTQKASQSSVTKLLTTGEGSTHEVLMAMEKAKSQVKTAAMVREKLVDGYQQIMNMQI